MSPEWAETGDRYLLKLFRDYVFHQNSADERCPRSEITSMRCPALPCAQNPPHPTPPHPTPPHPTPSLLDVTVASCAVRRTRLDRCVPVVDYAHVVETLNKLDAAAPERVVLMSRDEQSLLTVRAHTDPPKRALLRALLRGHRLSREPPLRMACRGK